MLFNSVLFLFYFLPVFLLFYFISPIKYRNLSALIGSMLFYFWGAPLFLWILLLSIGLDYYLGNRIAFGPTTKRKLYLSLSIVLNVGLLAYFKYANFFVENINQTFSYLGWTSLAWTNVMLPIGISFFTFQKLSYTIDIYRGKDQPLEKLSDFALYILLFPQLIAGPIVRFNEIADQIRNRSAAYTWSNKLHGLFRFSIGLSKKILIADPLGIEVDHVFNTVLHGTGTLDCWIILMSFAFQIYFDFSAYTDMAIGIGKMLGFNLPENFNFPYLSKSITEFWRRWHITLSTWMRDYLYFPLGGNRISTARTFANLWIVFIISGLWHGAAWTFLIWGIFHGFFLILDRLFLYRWLQKSGALPALFFTFFITLLGWVLFRANTFEDALIYYQHLFCWSASTLSFSTQFWVIFVTASMASFAPQIQFIEKWSNQILDSQQDKFYNFKAICSLLLLLFCFSEIVVSGFQPFIYFRF